jgi:hypothetical protein
MPAFTSLLVWKLETASAQSAAEGKLSAFVPAAALKAYFAAAAFSSM